MADSEFKITPSVNAAQEFIEIATDFSNPLDLVREAISNSFDAKAKNIRIAFSTRREAGESILFTEIEDDGNGMDGEGLKSFFDLGNSLGRDDPDKIGEKGHGTKVFFNSSEITVKTTRNGQSYVATMIQPFRSLHQRYIPEVTVISSDTADKSNGTLIEIKGYNNNRRDRFQQDILKDYVMWFTKFGSVELEFGNTKYKNTILKLKGLDADQEEEIKFGHFFPKESKDVNKLFDEYMLEAPEHYCRRIKREGKLKNFPEIKYQAVFSIEGNKVKMSYKSKETR
ncbi:MAG TPA: ATP-binding protein [Pyrinomonadaceae bacterium]|nr:ATP-binding protein [Pyrinomonadaceae bacterium]